MARKLKITFPKLTTKKVWAGMYGGHYDVIIFFHTKPVLSDDETRYGQIYDLIDNKDCIAGAMWLPDFHELTGATDMTPESIYVVKLHEIQLTAIWDGKQLRGYDMEADGWDGR